MSEYLLVGSFIFFGVIRIANSLLSEKTPVDYKGKYRYIINGEVSLVHPLTKSHQVLEINNSIPLSPKTIHEALYKQLEFTTEARLLGYKRKYSVKDYQAAKMYLLDYYDYVAFLN